MSAHSTSDKRYEVADKQMVLASSRWSAIVSKISAGSAGKVLKSLGGGPRRGRWVGLIDLICGKGSN